MSRKKIEFKCSCGHREDEHESNADSVFFSYCKFVFYEGSLDGLPETYCKCNEYKADNLRYLEDHVKRAKV